MIVSGADDSLPLKYADLAARMNLCNRNDSVDDATVISVVLG